jgi:protein SCO1/2
MRRRTIMALALVSSLGWLLAAALSTRAPEAAARALPTIGSVPNLVMLDEQGRVMNLSSLTGSVWIADFIFTRCAGQCPLMSGRMAALQKEFAGVPGVRLVSFTVDPEYDTPERLAAYARQYGARPAQWSFLTAERDTVWRLAREAFRLGVNDEGVPEEPIAHSVRLAIVDQQGKVRGTYDASDEAALARLTEHVRTLLGEPT